MDKTVIDADKLSKFFGDFKAVDEISFKVGKGEIFGFLGPNGSGKSTTIRMLCGVLDASAGSGRVLGYDISTQQDQIKSRIGYMSQKFSLYEDLTVAENIEFYAGIYGVRRDDFQGRADQILALAGLRERTTELAANLSIGWKQRLALGCALVHDPDVVFLDEPTAGVDPVSRRRFWDLLYQLAAEGKTLFVTTHYMEEAEHCHRLAFIYEGKLIALDTPARLKALVKNNLLEITCDNSEAALAALSEADFVSSAYMHGALLHIDIGDVDGALPRINALLTACGSTPRSVAGVQPSLEDVFVYLATRE